MIYIIMLIGIAFIIFGAVMFFKALKGIEKGKEQHKHFFNTQKDFKEYQEYKEEIFK